MENKVLSNLFGILGTIIWSIQLIPQIHLNYKMKSTKGVSPLCFSSWYLCGVVLATYLVFMKSPPALVIQISCFSVFCLVIIFQYLFYEKSYKITKLLFVIGLVTLLSFLISIGIYMIMKSYKSREIVIEIVCTVISASLMAIGFFPQMFVIYKSKSTVGLSKIFVFMDFLGGVFSIMSLAFHIPFDWMAFSTYVIVPIFQSFLMGMIFYYDPKRAKNSFVRIKESETDFEQHPNCSEELSAFIPANPTTTTTTTTTSNNDPLSMKQSAHLVKETQVITSSTLLSPGLASTTPVLQVQPVQSPQEFDHISPESISQSTDSLMKQSAVLNQSTSILLTIPQPTTNGVHGYPVS